MATSARTGGRSERVGRLSAIGMLIVPLLIGGVLTWALSSPTEHLDRVTAAIVNDDEPVTVDGQTIPLGRQFAAALIGGADATDATQAPPTPNGSAGPSPTASTTVTPTPTVSPTPTGAPSPAASGDASDPSANFTWVLTNDDEAASGLAAGRYAAVVTIPANFSAAATSIGGPASAATQAVFTVTTTPDSPFLDDALTRVITETAAATLSQQLIANYLENVYAGFNEIGEQIGDASSGAADLATGAGSVSTGAGTLASRAGELSSGIDTLSAGADSLSTGLTQLDAAVRPLPSQTAELSAGADAVSTAVGGLDTAVSDATARFAAITAEICVRPGALCDRASAALRRLEDADRAAAALADGAAEVASGNAALAGAMPPLVAGIASAAGGAAQLADGSQEVASAGASLAAGAQNLADGAVQVDDGATQLANGLAQAVSQVPTYSDSDISTLSTVVSRPVRAEQDAAPAGFSSAPLFTVIALWLGALVISLVRPPIPTRMLFTAASSSSIALRASAATAALGAGQGLIVAIAVLPAIDAGAAALVSFIGAGIAVGAAFAVINHGLAALLGAVGRFAAVLVAVVMLTAGITATVPSAITSLAAWFPTSAALDWLLSCLTGDGGAALAAAALLAAFAVAGVILVRAGTARRRTVRGPAAAIG
ncbi:hypothetical protein [Microbacterium paludicola]|uniref:hypothetical protein n=1 Tax=Microbacterium paludicola TaxID=300019 RepID=UPI0011A8E793|nr:hypothetical protein [Microbacterium paludicola]